MPYIEIPVLSLFMCVALGRYRSDTVSSFYALEVPTSHRFQEHPWVGTSPVVNPAAVQFPLYFYFSGIKSTKLYH